jgi:PAS domain S-box-containing protein
MDLETTPLQSRFRSLAFAAGITAMVVSAAVLLGWAAHIPWLTNLSPRFVTMKPATALCFFLSGLSLSLLAPLSSNSPTRGRVAQGMSLFVVLIGAATVMEFAAGVNLHFESLLFGGALDATGIPDPGRLSLASGIGFALLGLALLLVNVESRQGVRPTQYFALCVLYLSLLHLLGYLYDVNDLYRTFHQNSMAVHTAALFFLLSLGVLAARPDRGLAAVFNGPGIAGQMARRVLPTAAVLTITIAWIRLFFERRGFYGTGFGLAIFASANITIFSVLVFLAARSLNASIEQLNATSRDLASANQRANLTNFRLAAIIESSDDAIISKSLEGIITTWNAGAERIFGYSCADAVGKSIRMLLPPDRLAEETEILQHFAKGESVEHFESMRVRKDGKQILVSVTISPLRDATGAIVGISKIARDITETRRTEQAVQEQEARLAAIIGSAMDGIITVDARQLITMFNPAAEAMFGCQASDVLGTSLERFLPARFRAEHTEHIHVFGETQVTRRRMGRMGSIYGVRSTGEEFPIEASISKTEVQGKKIFTVILRDITDRKGAEEELRQQAVLLDLAPVFARDMNSNIILCTRGAERLYGYSKQEAVGRVSHDLLQTQFPSELRQIEKTLHSEGAWEGELNHRTRDGHQVFVHSQWVVHHDSQGKPAGILEVNGDLTELKRTQALQMRSQKLESLGTLAGGVAHDFNNILLAINGNAKLALDDLASDHPARRNLSEIAKAGARAADLIRRILSFSRPQEQNREPQAVQPVIEEALKLVRATLPASIQIESFFSPDLPPVALDSTQLHQVIVNLATNASHAIGDQPGVVTVRLSSRIVTSSDRIATPDLREGRYVCLSVSDNGAGMDRATLGRVFDPFFTTKPVGKGTGLGLSVVHGIVSSHGGAVTAYSQPGKGTSFVLFFPVADVSIIPPTAPPPVLPPAPGRQENILYVDDEEGLVMLGTLFLQRLGYQVTGHIDAAAALYDFNSRPNEFAAVVTDLSMPRMSGFDLVRELFKLRPDLPIILTSGYIRPEDQKVADALGIAQIILKPSTIDTLGHALNEILHHSLTPAKTIST